MELEEDINLKILDEVKRAYLKTFDILKNGKLFTKCNEAISEDENMNQEEPLCEIRGRITFLYKFLSISPIPLTINERTGGRRQVFCGQYQYGKSKMQFRVIAKTLEIEMSMIQMFKQPQQCYILHDLQIYEMLSNQTFDSKQNYSGWDQNKHSQNHCNFSQDSEDIYYILDENSQILEDDSMDFISTLTRLTDSAIVTDELVFETNYSSQFCLMQKPLNFTHFKLLPPKVISSFEGIILDVQEGKNLLQIEELVDQINLSTRKDRFYVLKVASGRNYTDIIDVFLIYDNEDQDAKMQLSFYLKPFQRILIYQSLKHFTNNLRMFIISFFYSPGVQPNNSNFGKFLVSPKGLEFFSRSEIDNNKYLCSQLVQNYNKLKVTNLQMLLKDDESVMMRYHMRFNVKVKKIKYFKIRLNCSGCKQEWTKGFKHCINCKEQSNQVNFCIQALVQDQTYLDQQAYLYLYDEHAEKFFNITEQEKKDILNHLTKNETYMQLYYNFKKEYSLSIIKFKDRIFTKDIHRQIVGVPFADLSNKVLNQNQQTLHEEKLRIENENFIDSLVGNDSKLKVDRNTQNKKQVFINGTYIVSHYSQQQKITIKPIPCLKVVHVFPQEDIKLQSLNIIQELANLKIQIKSLQN